MTVLNEEQVGNLIKGLEGDRFGPLIIMALKTGLRQGELLALQWDDVDLKAGFLSVRHTLQNDKGVLSLAEPKTKSSRRRIELGQTEIRALRKQQQWLMSKGIRTCKWVFPTSTGEPQSNRNVVRAFKSRLTNLKLPAIRFHDLRHTAATLMLLQGIHPKVVQERLGHATIAQTMDTYSHVLPSMQRDATKKMDKFFASIV